MNKEQELELCIRCKKNKATLTYTNSGMDFIHGFTERICQECYDKQTKDSNWYKKGYHEAREEFERLIDECCNCCYYKKQLKELANPKLAGR